MGHAVAVVRRRHRVISIDVHGLGGVCRWQGEASPLHRAQIAWGGVQFQALALLGTMAALGIFGEPTTPFAAELARAFTTTNVWLIGLNLIPISPLDGAEAWKIVRLRWRARRRARAAAVPPPGAVERE